MTEKDTQAILYYVYDPMCSWCWGYAPTWQQLQQALAGEVAIQYCIGGLAADSNEPMADEMQQFLQKTWRTIASKLGTEFNFDFWQLCQPRRSTYPACRAMLVARGHQKEQAMLSAIQSGYYLQAKNPSDNEVLAEFAHELAIEPSEFLTQLTSATIEQQLQTEISFSRSLPIQGFPSLVLSHQQKLVPIKLDYKNWTTSYQHIMSLIIEN